MPRRVSLPGANELFRPTSGGEQVPDVPQPPTPVAEPSPAVATPAPAKQPATGRVRHDEKITVYVSRDELMALESGRLALRGDFGLAVDRGRIVRESIALAMADLAHRGAESDLVRRLNGE